MKDLLIHTSPSIVSGFLFGLFSANIYLAMLICFAIQYYYIRQQGDRKTSDGTYLGTMLGLSTVLYLPAAFVGYIIGKSLSS